MPQIPHIEIKPAPEALAPVEPCTLVIFGGSGDLSRRRLIPAGLLPKAKPGKAFLHPTTRSPALSSTPNST